jgi:hypothetical protein
MLPRPMTARTWVPSGHALACIYSVMYVLTMTTQRSDPRLIRPRAAISSIVCAVASVLLMTFAQVTQAEVVPSWQPPSELALGATGWAMTASFAVLGLSCVLLFVALRGQPASRTAGVGRYALLAAAAAGVLTAGMGILMPQSGSLGPDVPIGWQARGLLLADAAWVAIAAGCALAVSRGPRTADDEPVLVGAVGATR